MSIAWSLALAGIVAASACGLTLSLLTKWGQRYLKEDVPNERSSHVKPTLRGGGLGIVVGLLIVAGAIYLTDEKTRKDPLYLVCALGMGLLGWLDDQRSLPAKVKLSVQCIICLVALSSGKILQSLPLPAPLNASIAPVLGALLTFVWLLSFTNIYNFLDGIDGYAGVQAALVGIVMCIVSGSWSLKVIWFALAGASCMFLRWNWQPARVFMGDVGSLSIGFLIAALPLQESAQWRSQALGAVFFCVWAFIGDGVLTLLRRLLSGKRILEAHREHLYQQYAGLIESHGKAVIRIMSVNVVVGIVGAWSWYGELRNLQWATLGLAASTLGLLQWAVWCERERRGKNKVKTA